MIPLPKVVSGRLLNDAAESADVRLQKVLKGRCIGILWVFYTLAVIYKISTDLTYIRENAWDSIKKDSVNAICTNVDFKVNSLHIPKHDSFDLPWALLLDICH